METSTFADHLSRLDQSTLERLLDSRPETRIEPIPRGFTRLAQRLSSAQSLSSVLQRLNADELTVSQVVAALGDTAIGAAVARLLSCDADVASNAVESLTGKGLLWRDGDVLRSPETLREHWTETIGGAKTAADLAAKAHVDELRAAARALDTDPTGLRKPDLITVVTDAYADVPALMARVSALPARLREHLDQMRRSGTLDGSFIPALIGRDADPEDALVGLGLLLPGAYRTPELPREVAVAAWLCEGDPRLTGRPSLPAGAADESGERSANIAASEAIRAVTSLMDEATTRPLAALRKGGVGKREQSRLSSRLSTPVPELTMWIDVAHRCGLLVDGESEYVAGPEYERWRGQRPAQQWARLAWAWRGIDHCPTFRVIDDEGATLEPPLPLASKAGLMRRALLDAAEPVASLRAVADHLDWLCPLHGYPPEDRDEKIAAIRTEADLLGVTAGDRLSRLGQLLARAASTAQLAEASAEVLTAGDSKVFLQSDLTATVSGVPESELARLLSIAAGRETRGFADVWRFSATGLRDAFDAGWTAESVKSTLAGAADHPVPQTLERLIDDAWGRHGHIAVHTMRTCLVADEPTTAQLLRTKALSKLNLRRIAPTVLASSKSHNDLMTALRKAGMAPVSGTKSGPVTVSTDVPMTPARRVESAPIATSGIVSRLLADPDGSATHDSSTSRAALAGFTDLLNADELDLLSHALDTGGQAVITYVDRNGTQTLRCVKPQRIRGKWLDSWCLSANGLRDFTIANILSVAPETPETGW